MSRLGFLILIGVFSLVFVQIGVAGDLFAPGLERVSYSSGEEASGPPFCVDPSLPARAASCAAPGTVRTAQSGPEACGCQAGQSCCSTVCCPSSHPHYCPGAQCYETFADAQAVCGNSFEVCGVPQ